MLVKLIAWSSGLVKDPRRLVLLAIKTSAGKLKEKPLEHYLKEYPEDRLSEWLLQAVKYPSTLEHITFTFYIEGISRVTSHQLVRHRIASYTQESQRYSTAENDYITPPSIANNRWELKFKEYVNKAYELYNEMIKSGIPYEDARYILPQASSTRLLMTVNLREFIHIACLRTSIHAQWEIKELLNSMVNEVSKVIPEINELILKGCEEGI